MNNDSKNLLIVAPLALGQTLFEAFVFFKCWAWFIVPTFNFQEISFLQALAIMVITRLFKSKRFTKYNGKLLSAKKVVKAFVISFTPPVMTLIYAFIIKLLIDHFGK